MKTTKTLKKFHFIVALMSFASLSASAQLKVTSAGNTYMGVSTPTPQATLSIGHNDGYNYSGYSFSLSAHQICSSSFSIGVKAVAKNTTGSYRAIGLQGLAGGATTGWNYGVLGGLTHTTGNGAGIFGTLLNHTGIELHGRYAGYFDGETYVDGNLTTTTLLTPSDLRLKENVQPLNETTDKGSTLENVLNMNVIKYNYKERELSAVVTDTLSSPVSGNDTGSQVTHYGLSAQELQDIYPDLVQEGQDGYLTVNYVELVPILIRSIQELKAELDELKGMVGAKRAYGQNCDPFGRTEGNAGEQQTPVYFPITVDGKVIGTKYTNRIK